MRLLTLLALLACASAASATEVYRWVDKDGIVHFGDKPKHDAEQLNVEAPGTPVDDASEQAAAARAAECDRQKKQIDTYRQATVLKETNNLGQVHEYTPEEREAFLKRLEQKANEACGPAPAAPENPPAQ